MSIICQETIQEDLNSTLFSRLEEKYILSFTNYIVEKHEIVNLIFDENSQIDESNSPLENIIERIKNTSDMTWR